MLAVSDNGSGMTEATKRRLFDLLVTDVIMPGSSAPKLFERLSSQYPDLKVLHVSGYTDDTIATLST